MRAIFAVISVALLTALLALHATPSAAQKGKGRHGDTSAKAPPKKADDKDYKAAVEGLPDQKFDPWRNLR
jgi:hypothetical protein